VAQTYGDKRRTVLSAGAELVYDAEAYVVHEDTTVVVTRDGWMKRLGEIKDPSATRVREGDLARWILRGNTRDSIALLSNLGIAYVLKITGVPATTGYGEPVQSLLNFKDRERVIAAALVPGGEGGTTGAARWLVASARGMGFVCRPDLSETTKSGRRIARVKDGDEIVTATAAEGNTITAATAAGNVLSFPAAELPELSGPGRGVILMRVDEDDRLIGAVCHAADQPPIALDEEGSERRLQTPEPAHRAQKGRRTLKRFKPVELIARPAVKSDDPPRDPGGDLRLF